MASDRLAELLRSRSEFTEEEVNRMTESEAWQWIHARPTQPTSMGEVATSAAQELGVATVDHQVGSSSLSLGAKYHKDLREIVGPFFSPG